MNAYVFKRLGSAVLANSHQIVVQTRGLGNAAIQIDIVVQMAGEVRAQVWQSVSRVANELALGHFVLDGGTGQVDGEEDEREAEDVDGVFA